uniref:Uncharacterized protein n=1 Tax=Aureoumbra lagunensis TaxID=44058 RepID=A0A7S3NPM3_9STRA|mmetsp:Transcript_21031/g.32253  ORF Transcript_21031/g.32253 Transcript_21031/m.32253 type:complete len:212 (-) Transcript_21031:205-840(-)
MLSKLVITLYATFAGVALGFVSPNVGLGSTQLKAIDALETMEGATMPMGVWDPLGLTDLGTEKTLAWFRAAEIKHSRVAMFAFVGWLVGEAGITFPGDIATGVPFSSLGKGLDAWANVPDAGKLQILAFLGMIEISTETQKPHYLCGGKLGYIPVGNLGSLWLPWGTSKASEADLSTLRSKELNNGRLAMIAIMSVFAASSVPGSVPLLNL